MSIMVRVAREGGTYFLCPFLNRQFILTTKVSCCPHFKDNTSASHFQIIFVKKR